MRAQEFVHKAVSILFPILILGTTGCGDIASMGDPNNKIETQVVRAASDEVKMINAAIKKPDDSLTIRAAYYSLSSSSRLLLRLSSLKGQMWKILDQQAMLLKLETKTAEISTRARPLLKICPLIKNWMMLATWTKAHPYRDGAWAQSGGDFEPEACLEALPANHASIASDDEANFCQGATRLCFDLKPWFQSYVRERQVDFGLIVIAETDEPILILGDATLQGPSLLWRRMR